MEKVLFTRKQAASALSLSVATLDKLIASRQIIAVRVGRKVLLSSDSVHNFVDNLTKRTIRDIQDAATVN